MGQGKGGGGKCRIKCTNIQFWVPLVIRKFRVYLEIGFIVVVPFGGWRRGKVLWEQGREGKGTFGGEGKGKDRIITEIERSLEIGNLSSIFQKSIPKDTYHTFPRHCLQLSIHCSLDFLQTTQHEDGPIVHNWAGHT